VPARRISTGLLLPILSMAAWVFLIATPTTLTYVDIQQHARGAPAAIITNRDNRTKSSYRWIVPRKRFLSYSADHSTRRFGHIMTAANLPAVAIELPIDRFTPSWPMTWTPFGMTVEAWRAITYPIYGLPFWWFVGVGIDGLLRRRHLRWPICLIGTLFCGLCIFLTLGMTFGISAEEHKGMAWVFCSFSLWIALLIPFPATWILQWRSTRQSTSNTQLPQA
jgi:hypothetical protein